MSSSTDAKNAWTTHTMKKDSTPRITACCKRSAPQSVPESHGMQAPTHAMCMAHEPDAFSAIRQHMPVNVMGVKQLLFIAKLCRQHII